MSNEVRPGQLHE